MQSNLRFRPGDLKDIIGNRDIIVSLDAIFSEEEKPHTFLFSGPAGCGKTTLARIVCDLLQCAPEAITELNMSNNRGIDTAREIIQNSYLSPIKGKVKVYLLDEAHKATNEFQNAMLKILEEPPPHVYFILCTTEPKRLLPTVLGRCTKFEVAKLPPKKIRRVIKNALDAEEKVMEDEVIDFIIDSADGVPRDALILLDKVVNIDDVQDQLNSITSIQKSQKNIIDLCRALLEKKKWEQVAKILSNIEDDPENIRRAVLGYFGKVLLNNGNARAALIIENFSDNYYDSGRAGLIHSCYCCYL